MKKICILLVLVLCSCLKGFCQATSLTVDCQTPGWLSSKINYGDQQTVIDLIVTGYLNKDDIKFIGTLFKNYSLKRLDMEQVDLVSSNSDEHNTLVQNFFDNNWSNECHINKIVLPLSIQKIYQSRGPSDAGCFSPYLYVDTLVIGGPKMPTIQNSVYRMTSHSGTYFGSRVKCLIIREGVESIADNCFYYPENNSIFESIVFPSTLKIIGARAFCGNKIKNIELPDALEEIGMDAFRTRVSSQEEIPWSPTVLVLPASIKKFNFSSFNTPSKVYYFPSGIEYIDNIGCSINYVNSTVDLIEPDMPIEIHIKKTTPPDFNCHNFNVLKSSVIYVPTGCANRYMNKTPWDKATIVEEVNIEGISIVDDLSIHVGDKTKLKVQVLPTNATITTFKWESSNEEVASVSEDGTVKAISYGTTDITATTEDGGFKAICEVNVYEHTTGVKMAENTTIHIGDQFELNAQTLPLSTSDGKINYSSNDTDVATVSEVGEVKGKKKGTCTITATSVDGGYTAQCVVSVLQPVEAISLEKHTLNMNVGDVESLYAQVIPLTADNKKVKWSSSDENIVVVSDDGDVTAKKMVKQLLPPYQKTTQKLVMYVR